MNLTWDEFCSIWVECFPVLNTKDISSFRNEFFEALNKKLSETKE